MEKIKSKTTDIKENFCPVCIASVPLAFMLTSSDDGVNEITEEDDLVVKKKKKGKKKNSKWSYYIILIMIFIVIFFCDEKMKNVTKNWKQSINSRAYRKWINMEMTFRI